MPPERSQALWILKESLEELPANMREILLLVGLDELSYEEAAAMLTVPVGTVRSRLSRARAALRKRIEEKGLPLQI
jgi:RNA polymerase sigma factor (sigma-70 family)